MQHAPGDSEKELGRASLCTFDGCRQLQTCALGKLTLERMTVERLAVVPGERHGLEECDHARGVGLEGVAVPHDLRRR